jgi:hypothetical protein
LVPTEHSRATWTDERLDDLARRMDEGFERIDTRIGVLDSRIDSQGESLAARIDAQGASLNARIDALQRTMLVMMATMLIGFVAVLAQL